MSPHTLSRYRKRVERGSPLSRSSSGSPTAKYESLTGVEVVQKVRLSNGSVPGLKSSSNPVSRTHSQVHTVAMDVLGLDAHEK